MTDPNLIYKAKFAELAELLGRPPKCTDSGWVALHEEYKKSWAPSEETVRAPRAMAETTAPQARADTGFSRKPAPQAGGIRAVGHAREDGEATGGPRAIQTGAGAGTAGTRVDASPRLYQAGRGPNGGVLAVCEGCGEVWEREKRRGRPSLLCGECR